MRSRCVPGSIVLGIHIFWIGAARRHLVLATVHAVQHRQEQGQDAAGPGGRGRSSPEVPGHHSILETKILVPRKSSNGADENEGRRTGNTVRGPRLLYVRRALPEAHTDMDQHCLDAQTPVYPREPPHDRSKRAESSGPLAHTRRQLLITDSARTPSCVAQRSVALLYK